jgi:hypothetical protein
MLSSPTEQVISAKHGLNQTSLMRFVGTLSLNRDSSSLNTISNSNLANLNMTNVDTNTYNSVEL